MNKQPLLNLCWFFNVTCNHLVVFTFCQQTYVIQLNVLDSPEFVFEDIHRSVVHVLNSTASWGGNFQANNSTLERPSHMKIISLCCSLPSLPDIILCFHFYQLLKISSETVTEKQSQNNDSQATYRTMIFIYVCGTCLPCGYKYSPWQRGHWEWFRVNRHLLGHLVQWRGRYVVVRGKLLSCMKCISE